MTKLHLLIIGILLSSTMLWGQTFNEKYFTNTDWFSNNKDSGFYKLDTLKFIKYSNYGPEWAAKEYAEYEMKFLNHGDFVVFGFKRHGKMNFSWRYNNYRGVVPGGQWTWMFESKTNELIIYDDKKVVLGTFRPIYERPVKIESRFAEQKDLLSTTELTLIRIK
jgi:hypothetical protein